MSAPGDDDRLRDLEHVARQQPGLSLLVLYGSRGRGEGRPDSDWDLGYLADSTFDPDAFLVEAVRTLGSDAIDLVDLRRASGQLRYRVAGDARVVFARTENAFASFWLDAVAFWCDVGPALQAGYRQVLKDVSS